MRVTQRERGEVRADGSGGCDKYQDVKLQIEKVIDSNDQEQMQKVQEKIRNMRQQGLQKHGEFGTENLVFKLLRRDGTMDRLWKKQRQVLDKQLSLN